MVSDITEQKRREAQGRQSWDAILLLARAVEQTADSVMVTDRHGIIEYVNPAFETTVLAGSAFLPEFHEGTLTLSMNTMPGTSLAKSDEIGRRVEQILLSQPEVVATARRQGRAEYDEHVQGVEGAEIDVGLRETGRPRADRLAELRRQFSAIPGTNVVIGQPISDCAIRAVSRQGPGVLV